MVQRSIITALFTCYLFSLCKGEDLGSSDRGCRVLVDAHDRAAMYSRNFIGGQSNRWPNGEIPYIISSSFTASERQVILDSIKHISDRTCVNFVPRTSQTNYVDIYTGERGCFANLGYNSGRTRSVLHLQQNGCVILGIVVHELLHILGFGHEQTRADRDEYIQINWDNIQSGTYSNFWRALGETESASIPYCGNVGIDEYDNCHAGFRASTFGKAYDYGSVMHYGLNFFTNNGQNTMTLKKSTTATIPNRSGMSALDVEKTQAAYQCDDASTTTEAPTTSEAPTTTPSETTSSAPSSSSTGGQTTTSAPSTIRPTPPPSCRDKWRWCDRYTDLCGRHPFINRKCKKTCFNCECKNKMPDDGCSMLGDYCRFRFVRRLCAKECGKC